MPQSSPDPPRASWTSLLNETTDAVFLLNPRRRLRYVNHAFETLTKSHADQIVHEYCHPRKIQKDLPAARRALLQTLAPPAEVMQGRSLHLRRPVPPAKLGPPWWDISFVPLRAGEKLLAVIGFVVQVGEHRSTAGGKGISESLVALREKAIGRFSLSLFDGEAPSQRRIHAQAGLAAKTLAPVWITGATGTGKQTLAKAIHYHGVTRELSFAAIDCAGLQPFLIRSLLFGHNGLAETGKVGTIYLKSPESLPTELQSELIEWRELLADQCRVAVGVSTGSGLSDDFRAALGVIEIQLRNLAERTDELPAIVSKLVDDLPISTEAMAILAGWSWPGNLRELRDVIRSSSSRANGSRIEATHLPRSMRKSVTEIQAAATATKLDLVPKLDEVLEQVERRMIELALRKSKGDQTAAAEILGVYRSRLVRRIKSLGFAAGTETD